VLQVSGAIWWALTIWQTDRRCNQTAPVPSGTSRACTTAVPMMPPSRYARRSSYDRIEYTAPHLVSDSTDTED